MISVVIYYHSSRRNNLEQTLRFLKKRETIDMEIILVCQDSDEWDGPEIHYNLYLPEYHKTRMCNFGVYQATSEVVALLDSDRILPAGYFAKCLDNIRPGLFITTETMYKLEKDYSDEELENTPLSELQCYSDMKSVENKLFQKNLFAGNTVMYKQDYLDCGGMDESFVNYGFADTDMTQTVMANGYKIMFFNDVELHLHHPSIENVQTIAYKNAIKYCLKWSDLDNFSIVKEYISSKRPDLLDEYYDAVNARMRWF